MVAAAVARRAGVDETVLDEVRLAVGEACSRAVGLHRSHDITAPVTVVLIEEEKAFSIEVGDAVPGPGSGTPLSGRGGAVGGPGSETDADSEDEMGLAVISGLVDDVEVRSVPDGGVIRMSWPATPVVAAP